MESHWRERISLWSPLPVYFEPFHQFEIFLAPGYEFERHQNLALLRIGVEYDLYIANDWWIAPEVVVDLKQKYYNYAFGIKLKKTFGPRDPD